MAPTRTPLIAGNWKMNLNHQEAVVLVQKLAWILQDKKHDFEKSEVAVMPPFTDLRSVQTIVDGDRMKIRYGAQDVSVHDSGAYTGEISASMLSKLGCSFAIVGHSERREHHGETDAIVAAKALKAIEAGMTPIVCVGEKLHVRQDDGHLHHCTEQIEGSLNGLSPDQVGELVVAYEPVWAIGTGEVATPEDAQEVCSELREQIAKTWSSQAAERVRILYGGSVKASNAAAIMAQPDVDGALVGGASLQAEEFAAICRFYDLPDLSGAA